MRAESGLAFEQNECECFCPVRLRDVPDAMARLVAAQLWLVVASRDRVFFPLSRAVMMQMRHLHILCVYLLTLIAVSHTIGT